MGTTSKTLLARLKDGPRPDDWGRFVERYWRLIYWVARRAGLSAADSEDVVQDVLGRMAEIMPGFEYDPSRGTFRGFLRTITERQVLDRLRTKRQHEPLPEGAIVGVESGSAGGLSAVWEQEWRRSRVAIALDAVAGEIEPRTFQAFQLVVMQGWPAVEAAKFLGLSVSSIYQAKSRVAARLREHLTRHLREE